MDASDYIAIASAVIALLAIGITFWQAHLAREHNFLSVRPKLNIHRATAEGCFFFLENHGLGPAIIQEFTVIASNKSFVNPTKDPYPEALSLIGSMNVDYDFFIPQKGEALAPNSDKPLLQITFESEEEKKRLIPIIVSSLKFKIVFSSIYENKNEICHGNGNVVT